MKKLQKLGIAVLLLLLSSLSARAQEIKQDTGLTFTGRIIDATTKRPIIARFEFELQPSSIKVAVDSSLSDGSFLIELPYLAKYGLRITADGYFPVTEMIGVSRFDQKKRIERNYSLTSLALGTAIDLQGITFETASSTLTDASQPALQAVKDLLLSNPTMRAEIAGHTDNVGDAEVNRRLSFERATSVVDYLIGEGIEPHRLIAKGFGESKPVATNATEKGREANRRVEFYILDK
jgi:OmpA-OmpF porin, OOP family